MSRDRLEDAIAAAEATGGRALSAPEAMPGMGHFAAVADPDGIDIGLSEEEPG
jgi:predicted enzyme related to lactoylglutathione lyase